MRYRIDFERIGRNRNVEPLHVLALSEADLCRAIRNHARPHLRSRDFDVLLDEDTHRGWLACGMHNGGDFTVHPKDQEKRPVPWNANFGSGCTTSAVAARSAMTAAIGWSHPPGPRFAKFSLANGSVTHHAMPAHVGTFRGVMCALFGTTEKGRAPDDDLTKAGIRTQKGRS